MSDILAHLSLVAVHDAREFHGPPRVLKKSAGRTMPIPW